MTQPTLTVAIVNWNVSELLAKCLTSLQRHLDEIDFEAIVVDNHSDDDSVAMVKARFPWVHLITNDDNLGFAKANNQAFRIARGQYILILNPDTEIKPGSIQAMIEILESQPGTGLVGPQVRDANGGIVRACRRSNISLWAIAKSLFLTDQLFDWGMHRIFGKTWRRFADRHYGQSGTTDCLQGSCMLMRRLDLFKVGLFDERVPLYLDDGDLCQRFQNMGFEIVYAAEAIVLHEGARSVAKMPNSRMSSMVGCLAIDTFFLKHGKPWQVGVYHFMLFTSSLVFIVVDLMLLPVLWFWKRAFIRNYLKKHYWSLVYSIGFQFKTAALPVSWPRSLREVLAAPENSTPPK